MNKNFNTVQIAHIESPYTEKFGIPRQSGLENNAVSVIVFEKEYRNPDALRGLDGFSHLWLVWYFSKVEMDGWSPTVRPPRLGGNKKMGVFATRSPYRPNRIGLSSVKIEKIDLTTEKGPVIYVTGADLLDGTPILDIKPYLAFTDCHADAVCGFADQKKDYSLTVEIPQNIKDRIPYDTLSAITEILKGDPRPSYQNDRNRLYGMRYNNYEIKFSVENDVLTVDDIFTI